MPLSYEAQLAGLRQKREGLCDRFDQSKDESLLNEIAAYDDQIRALKAQIEKKNRRKK